MILRIFNAVAKGLFQSGKKIGLTYNEMNIIVYYFIIPLSWTLMLDFIIRFPYFTPAFIVAWTILFLKKRKTFRPWCDYVFKKSVDFLLFFRKVGWNYEKASVIVCVLVPVAIYGLLIWGLISRY